MDDFGMGYALGSESNNGNNNGGWGFGGLGGDGGIWGLLILVLLLGGGRGFGGFGGFGGLGGGLGVAELQSSFNFNDLQGSVRGIQQGIADATYALNNAIMGGFHGVDNALCAGFNGVNNAINQSRFDAQQCCCETQKAISDSTTAIIQAGNNNTQRIIDIMTTNQIQDLRDKLADKDRDVLAANFQLSQLSQNATLINALRPQPVPAYQVCSPYQAVAMYDRCGCGAGYGTVAGA